MLYDIENGSKTRNEQDVNKNIRDIHLLKITNIFAIYYFLLFVICHSYVLLNN
jgi:hypothetical protein